MTADLVKPPDGVPPSPTAERFAMNGGEGVDAPDDVTDRFTVDVMVLQAVDEPVAPLTIEALPEVVVDAVLVVVVDNELRIDVVWDFVMNKLDVTIEDELSVKEKRGEEDVDAETVIVLVAKVDDVDEAVTDLRGEIVEFDDND